MMRNGIAPCGPSIAMVSARSHFGTGPKGPSPRARKSRMTAGSTLHGSASPFSLARMSAFSAAVSGAIALSRKTAGSEEIGLGPILQKKRRPDKGLRTSGDACPNVSRVDAGGTM